MKIYSFLLTLGDIFVRYPSNFCWRESFYFSVISNPFGRKVVGPSLSQPSKMMPPEGSLSIAHMLALTLFSMQLKLS